MDTPDIPPGYRLVSGPHTAAEVQNGWTITADWTATRSSDPWSARPKCRHIAGVLASKRGAGLHVMCESDDPERCIYRIAETEVAGGEGKTDDPKHGKGQP